MTLKYWTTAVRQTSAPEMHLLAATATATATATAVSVTVTATPDTTTTPTFVHHSPSALPATLARFHTGDTRRRQSVGFISTTALPTPDAAPLAVATPTRQFIKTKTASASRLRSLSSTWESLDSQDEATKAQDDDDVDDDDSEEKVTDRRAEQIRRDLVFTPLTLYNNGHGHPSPIPMVDSPSRPPHDHTFTNGSQAPLEATPSLASRGTTPRRRHHHPPTQSESQPPHRGLRRHRRRRTRSESQSSACGQRLRILTPVAATRATDDDDGKDPGRPSGWIRGQAAEVRWEVVDPTVVAVRIDVCNIAWSVPTTIAQRVANNGAFDWKRVYWGMPITDGYYVNIYDMSHVDHPPTGAPADVATPSRSRRGSYDSQELILLARSECFAVIG